MKIRIFWAVLLVMLYALTEATAWIAYRIVFQENYAHASVQAARLLLAANPHDEAPTAPPQPYLIHPYYGHVMNPRWFTEFEQAVKARAPDQYIAEPMNAWGFIGADAPVQPKRADRFIVGLTGGSVAAYAGAWGRQALENGIASLPSAKGKQVVLLNLATSAHKQPQQTMVLTDLLAQGAHFDLVVNLDGFNEIALPRGDGLLNTGISPFFPQPWSLLAESQYTRDNLRQIGRLTTLDDTRRQWARTTNYGPLKYSVLAATAWRWFDTSLQQQKVDLERTLRTRNNTTSGPVTTTTDGRATLGPPHGLSDRRDLYTTSATLWARSSVLMRQLVTGQGGRYVHLLQPNLHFPGSRPAGAADAHLATGPYQTEVAMGYPYLRSAGSALARAGVDFTDLTGLFKDTPAAVYMDTCCHITPQANRVLVDAILKAIGRGDMPAQQAVTKVSLDKLDFSLPQLRHWAGNPGHYDDGTGRPIREIKP